MFTIHRQELKFTKPVHLLQSKTILEVNDTITCFENSPRLLNTIKQTVWWLQTNIADWSLVYCRYDNRTAAGDTGCCAATPVVRLTGTDANRLTASEIQKKQKGANYSTSCNSEFLWKQWNSDIWSSRRRTFYYRHKLTTHARQKVRLTLI